MRYESMWILRIRIIIKIMKIPKRKSICSSNNKVGKIFKSFIKNKFDQEKEAESLKAFFQEDKPIKLY